MQRIIIFIVLCSFVYFPAKSVPAYPRKIQIKASDRTLYITLHGDEHTKWAMTEDNYTLLPDSSGWVYAQEDVNGYAVPSCYKLSDSENHLKTFLSSLKKIYPFEKIQYAHLLETMKILLQKQLQEIVGHWSFSCNLPISLL